jgi:glycosyltransferase involved in cell wall biosynthesis
VPVAAVAIVHDYLTQRGGAERVVEAMHRGFPDAPIYTSLYDPGATFPGFVDANVRASPLNKVPSLRRHHRLALPVLASAFSAMSVDADTVLCSSSGWAHGVRTRGRKIVYCYAPARWLYQADTYLTQSGRGTAALVRTLGPALRRWDRRAAASADVYLAISTRTRDLIHRAYGIDAEVLHPPLGMDPGGPQQPMPGLTPGFFLCVSRLLAYKHVDSVLGAFARLPGERLVVVGTGPDAVRLHAMASANAAFLATVSDEELRWLYANARAVIGASIEDFGLTPVEAAAFGTPSVVLRFGGYLETVIEGETGVYFDEPSPPAIAGAVQQLCRTSLDADGIRAHAGKFDESRFVTRLREIIAGRSGREGRA